MKVQPLALLGATMAGLLVLLLLLPVAALVLSTSWSELRAGMAAPMFGPAFWLSLRTSLTSLAIIVTLGTPLAWWLAAGHGRTRAAIGLAIQMPVVVPPAVLGVALLQTLGRQGLLGPLLERYGVGLPFTDRAVVIAQTVVAAPFFIQAATTAFRRIEPELLLVARSLGATPGQAFARVAVPMALPGLAIGASLAWARALGEFGATLLFAGNMTGRTQTLPLAIFSALESDIRLAVVFSTLLVALGTVLLFSLRTLTRIVGQSQGWRI